MLSPQPYEVGLALSTVLETQGGRRMSVAKGTQEGVMVGFGCVHGKNECAFTVAREKGS